MLIAAAELERWASEAVATLHRGGSLSYIGEHDSDVAFAWLNPGHVDGMALVVNHSGVMFPPEMCQREPLGVAQALSGAGCAERIPEARFVTHLPEPFRPADRCVPLAAFGDCGYERFGQGRLLATIVNTRGWVEKGLTAALKAERRPMGSGAGTRPASG